jgi:FkbM family methyltransferase
MNWQTSPPVLALRNLGRRLGINRQLALWLNGSGYETRYDNAFITALQPGNCVWDVGANVGYYTQLFADRIGPSGQVIAFEPSPINFQHLQRACGDRHNVKLMALGLGHEDSEVSFLQGSDDLGASSRIVDPISVKPEVAIETVKIKTGSGLIQSHQVPLPNAIKIDVEGFELEVLQGMANQLANPALSLIGIEVHFTILQGRGLGAAPQQINQLLQSHGFTIEWVDTSRLIATRHRP